MTMKRRHGPRTPHPFTCYRTAARLFLAKLTLLQSTLALALVVLPLLATTDALLLARDCHAGLRRTPWHPRQRTRPATSMPLPMKALLSYNLPPRRRPYTTAWHAARNGVGGEEGNSSSGSLDQTALRKLVARATELHDKNLASSSLLSGDALQSLLADLERESADPSFWDAVNARRQEVVTRDLAQYGRCVSFTSLPPQLLLPSPEFLHLLASSLMAGCSETSSSGASCVRTPWGRWSCWRSCCRRTGESNVLILLGLR